MKCTIVATPNGLFSFFFIWQAFVKILYIVL